MTFVRGLSGRKYSALASASLFALVAVGQAGVAGAAHAQSSAPAAGAQDSASVTEVVVTATRIVRQGFDAPTPTTVVGAADLQKTGATNVGDIIRQIPSFTGTTTASSTSLASQNAGGNFLNLRDLGNSRTLVLVDGRRFVPTTSTGLVDTNVIPSGLIDRVDIVTGGASAAWGSDAVAGVVNIILKKNLEGFSGNVQFGESQRGDNQGYLASLAYGSSFGGGRGHIELAGEYEKNDGIRYQYRRDWARNNYGVVTNTAHTATNGTPTQLIVPGFENRVATPGGVILTGVLANTQFGPGGVPTPFILGANASGASMQGGNGVNPGLFTQLLVPIERANVYLRGSYDLTDKVTAFAEASWATSQGREQVTPSFDFGSLTLKSDNAFLPAALKARLAAAGQTSFAFGRLDYDFGTIDGINTNNTGRIVAGLNGRLDGGWTWNASAEYGQTRYSGELLNNRIQANYALAVDSVINPATGQAVCRSTLTNPTNGCVPINLFGVGSPSAAALNYILGKQALVTHVDETDVAANIQGEPFSTWAGPVSTAFGVEYRRETLDTRVDATSLASGFIIGNPQPVSGAYDVEEGFFETVVPLAKDLTLIKSLDFNGAIRETHYSTSGSVTTWKAGLSYAMTDELRFRLTQSRDIRAPNLSELFTKTVLTFFNVTNPANGSTQLVNLLTSGNTALQPEKADTTTAGVVYEPKWFNGFRASVDYYNIDITGAISAVGAQDIVNRCYAGNQSFCGFITRDAAGNPTTIQAKQVNLAEVKTNGYDVELAYARPLSTFSPDWKGDITLRLLSTYVGELSTNDGKTLIDRAGDVGTGNGGLPHWRVNASQIYDLGPWSFYLGERYVGGGKYNNTFAPGFINMPNIKGQLLVDTSIQYTMDKGAGRSLQLYANVKNLFDKDPPVDPANFVIPLATNPILYDTIGRTFSVGARFKY